MTQLSRERLEEIRDYDTCVTLEESAEMARRLLAVAGQVDEVARQAGINPAVAEAYMQGYHDSESRKPAQHVAVQEPVAWRYRYVKKGITDSQGEPWVGDWKYMPTKEDCNDMPSYEIQALYAAPQPVALPDEMDLLTCHLDGVTETYAEGWNACRAAMLNHSVEGNKMVGQLPVNPELTTQQAAVQICTVPDGWEPCSHEWIERNGPNSCSEAPRIAFGPIGNHYHPHIYHNPQPVEVPLDYAQGEQDGREWAAQMAEANHPQTGDWLYDDPLELAKAIRKGPDLPIQPSSGALQLPQWIPCSEQLPPEGYEPDGSAVCYLVWHKNEVDCGPQYGISNVFFLRKHWEKNYTHWMTLPAAPQEPTK